MQIINDYSVNNIFETSFSTQSHKKSANEATASFDTILISDIALQAYAKSKSFSSIDEKEQDYNLPEQFKKHFNTYRGKGIFSEDNSVNEDNSINEDQKVQQAQEEKVEKTVAEIERKIKDLAARLETVMASNMPGNEKDIMANQIHKELEELQSQLNAYKQAEKALASAK